jgi:anti-anti-sigma factor
VIAVGTHGQETSRFSVIAQPAGPGRVTITVRGELDLAHAGELKHLLVEELRTGMTLLLDLSGVGFIDSTGLAAIVTTLNHANENGGELLLTGVLQPQARRLMELTGVLPLVAPMLQNGSG